VRIRVVNAPGEESIDGISLSHLRVGFVYSLPAALATLMIVEGWAEPVTEDVEPTLPTITFQLPRRRERRRRVLGGAALRRQFGIAADRRRRS
jgi:hypothetical protein